MPTTTETAQPIDHCLYDRSDARESSERRHTAQSNNDSYNGAFTRPRLPDIEMLCPLFDRIEAELDVKLHIGHNREPDTPLGHEYFVNAAGITPGTREVAIVRHASLNTPLSESNHHERLDTLNAVIDRVVEPMPDNLIQWSTPTGALLGLVAPHLITFHWWYRTDDSTPEQLDAIYNALKAAVTTALDSERWAEELDAMNAQLFENAKAIIANRSTTEINNLRTSVPNLVQEIVDLEHRARDRQSRLDEVKLQLAALEAAQIDPDNLDSTVERELRAIQAHPDVYSVVARPINGFSCIDVITGPLPLTNVDDTDQTTMGGSYRIRMFFGSEPNIRVRNLTRRIGTYDHPHVSDGNFCLGDQRQLADQLLSRSELSASVNFIIDLLKQVNPADVYTSEWEAWFDLSESDPA